MDNRVLFVIARIKDDLHQELTLDELAQSANLSVSRLHFLFRVETGMSPARYRRLLRIEKARDLLRTTFLSVKQVMACLGIDDRSHFERDFKKIYGLTPAQYRTTSARAAPPAQQNMRAVEMATQQ